MRFLFQPLRDILELVGAITSLLSDLAKAPMEWEE